MIHSPMLECWTTLAALATSTASIGLGSLVLGNTYRHPAVVANMAAALEQVSGAACCWTSAGPRPPARCTGGQRTLRVAARQRLSASR